MNKYKVMPGSVEVVATSVDNKVQGLLSFYDAAGNAIASFKTWDYYTIVPAKAS